MKKLYIGLLPQRWIYKGKTNKFRPGGFGWLPVTDEGKVERVREDFQITNQLSIKQIPQIIQSIRNNVGTYPPYDMFYDSELGLVYEIELPKEYNTGLYATPQSTKEEARSSIDSFSILAAIACQVNLFSTHFFETNVNGSQVSIEGLQTTPLFLPASKYHFWRAAIMPSELETLKNLYPKFETKRSSSNGVQPRFAIAINMFVKALMESTPQNGIAFLMTSLESIFMEDPLELGHKLSVRAACFLSNDYPVRDKIFTEMKKGYEIRSKTIHGDLSYALKTKIDELLRYYTEIRKHVCRILLKFMNEDAVWRTFESKEAYSNFLKRLDLGGNSYT